MNIPGGRRGESYHLDPPMDEFPLPPPEIFGTGSGVISYFERKKTGQSGHRQNDSKAVFVFDLESFPTKVQTLISTGQKSAFLGTCHRLSPETMRSPPLRTLFGKTFSIALAHFDPEGRKTAESLLIDRTGKPAKKPDSSSELCHRAPR